MTSVCTSNSATTQREHLYRAAWKGDKSALERLRTRAEQGDALAQFSLGWNIHVMVSQVELRHCESLVRRFAIPLHRLF
jgi:hypothetical protein